MISLNIPVPCIGCIGFPPWLPLPPRREDNARERWSMVIASVAALSPGCCYPLHVQSIAPWVLSVCGGLPPGSASSPRVWSVTAARVTSPRSFLPACIRITFSAAFRQLPAPPCWLFLCCLCCLQCSCVCHACACGGCIGTCGAFYRFHVYLSTLHDEKPLGAILRLSCDSASFLWQDYAKRNRRAIPRSVHRSMGFRLVSDFPQIGIATLRKSLSAFRVRW